MIKMWLTVILDPRKGKIVKRLLIITAMLLGVIAPISATPSQASTHVAATTQVASATCKTVSLTWRRGVSKRYIKNKVLWISVERLPQGGNTGSVGVNKHKYRLLKMMLYSFSGPAYTVHAKPHQYMMDFSSSKRIKKVVATGKPCR